MSETPRWKFWIDVGGTFTDCLAHNSHADGFRQAKVLSSGLSKGELHSDGGHLFVSPGEGDEFWAGAVLRLIGPAGTVIAKTKVQSYNDRSGEIVATDHDFVATVRQQQKNQSLLNYELDFGLPAPLMAIYRLLKMSPRQTVPDCSVYLGTTRGTNALLTRTGARSALVTTRGFGDLLAIGDQARPQLFELSIKKTEPLFEASIEIDERILADGTVEAVPDELQVQEQLLELRKTGIEAIAICLMHGFRFPQHEQQVAEIARSVGFKEVRLSSVVAPLIKIIPRAETTVLDAYLNPVLGNYLDQIQSRLSSESELQLMTSAGGLVDRQQFSGKDSVLSGPAGGIVGAARVAQQLGLNQVLTFDMGGTSSDVGRFDGEVELEFESTKSEIRIMTPMVAIETVAAGGGSVCQFDGVKLVVGPQSATSDPGPACYGRGGPLAVTDINLYLGRIVTSQFPFPLDLSAARQRLVEVQNQMKDVGYELGLEEIAFGFLEIANQNMASAVRSISIAKGYDPKEYALVAFGGAGPQHGCAVADAIGVETILDHPQASILSAVGIRLSDQTSNLVTSILRPLEPQSLDAAESAWAKMKTEIEAALPGDNIEWKQTLDIRYAGTDSSLNIEWRQGMDLAGEFAKIHERRFGFPSTRPLEVVAARLQGRLIGNRLEPATDVPTKRNRAANDFQSMWHKLEGRLVKRQVGVFDRHELEPGDEIQGPAIISSELSTTIVDPGWQVEMLSGRQLLITRSEVAKLPSHLKTSGRAEAEPVDPIRLEVFNNHFSSIARQMGIALQKTSLSVNVKERLDFSCAIFTANGDLVVNAPHIPVHLGAMSETVRHTIRLNQVVSAGDVFVTNDPFAGGSHLPDVTVVTPVFDDAEELVFWVASRSHHAEIGGIAPGSMPANATKLSEEGVLIRNFQLVDGLTGASNFDSLMELLSKPPYPSRTPRENLADIQAQVASNRSGQLDLLKLIQECGKSTVLAYMNHIQNAAESKIRQSLKSMMDGTFEFEDSLDNGATIRVSIEKRRDELIVDFSGTDPVLEGNLNANPAIVASAIIYVMRCLIDDDIPLNEGVMKPVSIVLPECFLNPANDDGPEKCPAVVGGNVETSQRIVDVLLGALQQSLPGEGLAAASQGTMNNWLMGDGSFGYYETVGGGSGATSRSNGADAVHTHMTNTRLTDPEVLESRYPAILRKFAIRNGSGGAGSFDGGDGMIREIEFLKPLTVSLLTNRRTNAPYGILGGCPGKPGMNRLSRNDGAWESLPSVCEVQVNPGDRLRLETPGGGGWGSSDEETMRKN